MNMKKLIASVIAGALAVSAMATSAFAAETTKKFDTFKSTTSVEGTATFIGLVTAHTAVCNITLPTAITTTTETKAAKYEITALTLKATAYTGDTLKAYASVSDAGVITVNPMVLAAGEPISVSVKFTGDYADDAATKTAWDKLSTTAPGYAATNVEANAVFTTSAKIVTAKSYLAIPATAKDLDNLGYEGIDATIAAQIGSDKGCKLVFNIKDTKTDETTGSSDPDYSQDNKLFSTVTEEDLAVMLNKTKTLSKAATIDKAAMTVTFDWDTLLKNSNITNAIGQVTTISIVGKNTLADSRFVIESISVVVPDAAATTEETTVVGTDTTTTTADGNTNPPTGATPVVLALIPAALAAVVIAKKRK